MSVTCKCIVSMAPAAPLGKPRCYIIPVGRNGWAPIPANNTYGWVPTPVDRKGAIPVAAILVDRNGRPAIPVRSHGWAPFLSQPFLSFLSTGMHSCRQECTFVGRNVHSCRQEYIPVGSNIHSCQQECIPVDPADRNASLSTGMYS